MNSGLVISQQDRGLPAWEGRTATEFFPGWIVCLNFLTQSEAFVEVLLFLYTEIDNIQTWYTAREVLFVFRGEGNY